MPKILNIKSYSFNVKVTFYLFLLALFLISILFALIIPKMQEEQYNNTIKEVEQVLYITQEQLKLAGKAIVMQKKLEKQSNKNLIALEVNNLQRSIRNDQSIEQIINKLKDLESSKLLDFAIEKKNKIFISKQKEVFKSYMIKDYNIWKKHKVIKTYNNHKYLEKYLFYTIKIANNLQITFFGEERNLNPNHLPFEFTLKKNIQNTFNITQNLHKGKTYVFWLNTEFAQENDQPLYIENIKKAYYKYAVSKLSNVTNIYTGNLTAKEVFDARNKGIIRHKLNGKPAISWVVDIYNEIYDGDISLLVKTVYEEDLVKQIDSSLLKILPAALISLLFAMIIGFFVFKKLFKTINILTDTAKEVNSGNKHIRSNVKGNDDIGYLGIAFDSMLDSFENNIKNLDFTVKEKTTKLQNSLEEKEILLREIHHRVKNNLALTISLIKLQQEEISEEKTNHTLNTIQERIYTMELIHRKLYESTNLNKIDFNEYVHNLVSNISKTYSQKNNVNINIQIEDVLLSLEKAMPCGLILNEIITNAFKYAFPNNPQPMLSIQIKKENDLCKLSIQDNGKGIKEEVNIYQSNTLGLKLINSIAKRQLKGTFKYLYKNGALFEIHFCF